jgi:hypothetical protein
LLYLWNMLGNKKGGPRFRLAAPLLFFLVLLFFIFVFTFRLGSQPAGLNSNEVATRAGSQHITFILNHPVNAPHNIMVYAFNSAGLDTNFYLRITSVVFGLTLVIFFYMLSKNWFGRIIGLLATFTLVATPMFLISARQTSAEIMFFSIIAVIALYSWLIRSRGSKKIPLVILITIGSFAIYTPGIFLWILCCALICRKKILEAIADVPKLFTALSALVGLFVIVPLAVGAFKDPSVVKELALLPEHFASAVEILKNVGWMALALFVKAPYHADLILGRLPLLNIIQIALLIFGIYAMWTAAKAKAASLLICIIFGIFIAGINNNIYLLDFSLVPAVIFIGAGLRYLYIEWRSIFPLNPVAKSLALVLMSCLVAVNLLLGLRYSLYAWPQSIATKTTYVLK